MRDTPDATKAQPDELLETGTDPQAGRADFRSAAPNGEAQAGDAADLLRKAEAAAREHHDAWLRAKAEADNIRKRAQAEITSAHKFALENFASELVAVKDSLEAALAADNATAASLKAGVELTLKQLAAVFGKFNITEVNPLGQKFDPHRHQAISTQPSDAEANTVLQVLQKGYLLHDRVVRPALVTVSRPVEK